MGKGNEVLEAGSTNVYIIRVFARNYIHSATFRYQGKLHSFGTKTNYTD